MKPAPGWASAGNSAWGPQLGAQWGSASPGGDLSPQFCSQLGPVWRCFPPPEGRKVGEGLDSGSQQQTQLTGRAELLSKPPGLPRKPPCACPQTPGKDPERGWGARSTDAPATAAGPQQELLVWGAWASLLTHPRTHEFEQTERTSTGRKGAGREGRVRWGPCPPVGCRGGSATAWREERTNEHRAPAHTAPGAPGASTQMRCGFLALPSGS